MKHVILLLGFVLCLGRSVFAAEVYASEQHDFKLTEMAAGLEHPWGLAFLPSGDLLVTERAGRLRMVRSGKLDPEPVSGLPENILSFGQGGLLDVALHPRYAENQLVYFSYSGKGSGRKSGTEVARGRFTGSSLENVEVIFKAVPKIESSYHYGSRLGFAADGTLFISLGDRGDMQAAQDPTNHKGAAIRVHDDGSVPKDNPYTKDANENKRKVFSYGHRNIQGLTVRPRDQSIWTHEHGPRGGDEVNKLAPGMNYGWPAITYGINYNGEIISDQTHAEGMQQPVLYWDPSIAPSGMAFYDGDKFPQWQGDLFVGALVKQHLRRLEMKGDEVVGQEMLLKGFARIRDVRSGPDGFLYILTDDRNGKVLRLEPA